MTQSYACSVYPEFRHISQFLRTHHVPRQETCPAFAVGADIFNSASHVLFLHLLGYLPLDPDTDYFSHATFLQTRL